MKILILFLTFFLCCGFYSPLKGFSPNHYIEIQLDKKNCHKALETECIFRDFSTDKNAYFHQTKLIIFQSKIIAVQKKYHSTKIYKIKDSKYKLTSKKGSLLSFDVKNGEISNFKVLKGDLKHEKEEKSTCQKTKFLYNFYLSYDFDDKIIVRNEYYNERYDKDAISEMIIFAPKDDLQNVMAVSRFGSGEFKPVTNLKLCRFPNFKKLAVKHVDWQDCMHGDVRNNECHKYKDCHDVIELDKNCKAVFYIGFDEFY